MRETGNLMKAGCRNSLIDPHMGTVHGPCVCYVPAAPLESFTGAGGLPHLGRRLARFDEPGHCQNMSWHAYLPGYVS